MNIAIIGAGLIGRKRASALPKGVKLTIVCDINKQRADDFARDFNCQHETDWMKVVKDPKIDALIISTTNKYLSIVAEEAISQGKHVLIEKPGARNLSEMNKIIKAFNNKSVVMFGYNHRFHPAILMAKKLIDSKKYGEILFLRAKYGHGGRLGYEKEWRFNKDLAGGGELLDQGTHLIDLVNYFCGPMRDVMGYLGNFYWNSKLEDTAFFILKNKKQMAELSVSCVEWKNIFQIEIILKTAKIQVDGLGRSYGREKLTLYKMKPEMGPPEIQEVLFGENDLSWHKEVKEFIDRIKKKEYNDLALKDAVYVLNIVKKLYAINL